MIALRLVHSAPEIVIPVFRGAFDGVGSLNGALANITGIAAEANGLGTVEATLTAVREIAGFAQGLGEAEGGILTFGLELVGTIQAIGVVQGLVSGLGTIQGDIVGVGAAVGQPTKLVTLASSVAGLGATTGLPKILRLGGDFSDPHNSAMVAVISL